MVKLVNIRSMDDIDNATIGKMKEYILLEIDSEISLAAMAKIHNRVNPRPDGFTVRNADLINWKDDYH
ncbi:hypothetical protein ABZP36_014724 [Zizania latifolia]